MKRFLAVLMLVVMMCGCVGLAEGKTFDPSVLEGKGGHDVRVRWFGGGEDV